jgi:hypothetical protein
MSVRVRESDGEQVLIEFRGHADEKELARVRAAYALVPRLRWKDVTVVLDSDDAFEPGVRDMLRDLSARVSRCRLKLAGKGREAAHA